MNLLFCGDIMPGGVLPYQDQYITPELLCYLRGFDFRIGTLESAIGTALPFDPVKMKGRQNIVYARDEDLFRVKEMGFNVVSLANNHVWDLGEEGLRNTIAKLRAAGIAYCGAGMDIKEASRPAVIEKDGIKVAILAYCMYGNPWLGYVELAKENKAGVNPLDIEKVEEDIQSAKSCYDKVLIMPHWGREYQYEPLPECVMMAKRMIDAGADAVLGSHTHQMQPLVFYKGKPICYSMGNFMFPDFYMYPPRPIWYPDSPEDIKDIKDVVGYPFPIEDPIRQVWNPVSRYGRTVALIFDNGRARVESRFVHSSACNVESLATPDSAILWQLKKTSLLLTNTLFHFLIEAKRRVEGFASRVKSKILSLL